MSKQFLIQELFFYCRELVLIPAGGEQILTETKTRLNMVECVSWRQTSLGMAIVTVADRSEGTKGLVNQQRMPQHLETKREL